MIDLSALPAHYVSVYGVEKVAEVLGVQSYLVSMWLKTGRFSVASVQKLLEFDPAPLSAITLLYPPCEPGKRLAILVPLIGPPEPKMMDTLIQLYDRSKMSYQRFPYNNLSVARNALAASFLRGPCEWSFWLDGDTITPTGNAEWFKRYAEMPDLPDVFAGMNTIHRLLAHKKDFVSVCYVDRKNGDTPQFGGGNTPEMRAEVKRGPRDKLIEVPWTGFGGVLIHRRVFEDIIRTQGDEIRMKPDSALGKKFGYEYSFFHPLDLETCGDDIPLCARARKAGHKIHVDLALMAGHVGDRVYSFKDL